MFYRKSSLILPFALFVLAISNNVFATDIESNPIELKKHVMHLTKGKGYRYYNDLKTLNKAAGYIHSEFSKISDRVYEQTFTVNNNEYKNVYASFGPPNAPRIIIGAHYDVCGEQKGADDNASGVAGLLDLARMLSKTNTKKWKVRVDLVAFSLEEPPFFNTRNMGSAVHANLLYNNKTPVVGMVNLEMIGYYDDRKKTQDYPIGLFKLFYGSRGNYITVVRKMFDKKFTRVFTRNFKKSSGGVRTKVFKAPKWVKGMAYSDHKNYWEQKWPAVMITDTGFFRNKNYHERTDTPETLDYLKMSEVVDKVYRSLVKLTR